MRFWTIFLCMTNRFGVLLHPDDVRWAAAEGVCENVIAAVLLPHERSADEIVPALRAAELEQMIKLVGRSPSVIRPAPSTRSNSGGHRYRNRPSTSGASDLAAKEQAKRSTGAHSPQSITRPAKRTQRHAATSRPWRRRPFSAKHQRHRFTSARGLLGLMLGGGGGRDSVCNLLIPLTPPER
jgi:hypothetical protein